MTLVARSRLLVVVLVLSSLSTTGCSYFFVQRPPANFREMNPSELNCTTSPAVPALDIGASAFYGLGLVTSLSGIVSRPSSSQDWTLIIYGPQLLISTGMLALHVGSASHGFKATKECEQARAILAARGESSSWSPGLATTTTPSAPAIPLGCTNTPEFRKASAREKKEIIDECKRRAAENAALAPSTPIPATPSEPPPPPPF